MIEKEARKETQMSNSLLKPKRVLTQAARWEQEHSRVGCQNLAVEEARDHTGESCPRLAVQDWKRRDMGEEEGNWVDQGVKGFVAPVVLTGGGEWLLGSLVW